MEPRRHVRHLLLGGLLAMLAIDPSALGNVSARSNGRAGDTERIFVDQMRPERSQLIVASADGTQRRVLVPGSQRDYNPAFSSDGQWIVFTSERFGNADIFRVHPSGMGLERLTDHPVYDDQGVLSPDGRSLAFVSSREGQADIYILDLGTSRLRNLTNSSGGDFRPSWSPDGNSIAFTSDRGTKVQAAAGRWEHLHAASIYIADVGRGTTRRMTQDPAVFAGSPKWSSDGRRIIFYELPVADTFAAHYRDGSEHLQGRIISLDVATGARTEHAAGKGLKVSPQFVGGGVIGYLEKGGKHARLAFTDGRTAAAGDIGGPSWSPDGKQVVYHTGHFQSIHDPARPIGDSVPGIDARFSLAYAAEYPSVSPDGRSLVVGERTISQTQVESDSISPKVGMLTDDRLSLVVWNTDGTSPRRIYRSQSPVIYPQWSRDGQWVAFSVGAFFLDRGKQPAHLMMVRNDGSSARTLTTGEGNSGFPSFSPDGKQLVYRFWTNKAGGLRLLNVADGTTRTLTTGFDNFPMWSPTGDRILFSRLIDDDFELFTMRPDGTDVKRLTTSTGNDAHASWSPDGKYIVWSGSRFGFRDEAPLVVGIPQPYADTFVMKADGTEQRALTNDQWEEGTPAWQRGVANASRSRPNGKR